MQLAALLNSKLKCPAPKLINLAALLNKEWTQSASATSGITAYTGKEKRGKKRLKLLTRSKP